MDKESLEKLRYPIGKFDWDSNHRSGILEDAIIKIKTIKNMSKTYPTIMPKNKEANIPPIIPSKVFFGLIFLAI